MPNVTPDSATPAPWRASDSPWYWAIVFGLTALVGLAAISPKFLERQARLDARHAGREQAWRNRLGETEADSVDAAASERSLLDNAQQEMSPPRVRWIVGGLGLLLLALVAVAGLRLRAERRAALRRADKEHGHEDVAMAPSSGAQAGQPSSTAGAPP